MNIDVGGLFGGSMGCPRMRGGGSRCLVQA